MVFVFPSSKEQCLVAERFLQELVRKYGKHPVSTDGGTWYPQACKFLKLDHHFHSPYRKSIIERTIQFVKDRTKFLMIIFHVERKAIVN